VFDPFSHGLQEFDEFPPTLLFYVPSSHSLQLVCFSLDWNVPTGHLSHSVDSLSF
jgi:hypothetical protein